MINSSAFENKVLIEGLLEFKKTANTGIAFSIDFPKEIIIGVSILIIVALLYFGFEYFNVKKNFLNQFLFGIIIGGASGNLVERITEGAVTDFIAVSSFPVFNIADIGITVGLLILFLRSYKTIN